MASDSSAAADLSQRSQAAAGVRLDPDVQPRDAHNLALIANVHPGGWVNPEPARRYNLVVVGGGTAGLVCAAGAAGLGAKVALIERHLLGGDCLNVGCVPSKTVIRSARVLGEIRDAERFGVRVPAGVEVDFGAVMERLRRLRAQISPNDSAWRFRDELGIDVFQGSARFTGADTVEVEGKTLRFSKAVIASGARATHPEVPGLVEAGFLTNETVFNLTARPNRLLVIGGGPIGCELAQAFHRLGSEVILVNDTDHILNREDADAAAIVQNAFRREGIRLELGCRLLSVQKTAEGKRVHFQTQAHGAAHAVEVVVDEILVGAGRAPNIEDLGLEAAGVKYEASGVTVNDAMQTSNPRIYAAGDVCMEHKFTHAADAAARIVIQNALFPGPRQKRSSLVMPWCTYTDPEIAHVGLYERDAAKAGFEIATFTRELRDVDRSITDGEEEGFVKIHVKKGTDKIVGATIVAPHAGEMIGEVAVAIAGGVGLGKLASVIHPYPTVAVAIRQCGDAYRRTLLSPTVKRLFNGWLKWTR